MGASGERTGKYVTGAFRNSTFRKISKDAGSFPGRSTPAGGKNYWTLLLRGEEGRTLAVYNKESRMKNLGKEASGTLGIVRTRREGEGGINHFR